MKKHYTAILLLTCGICYGQNLVPNGDFEQYYNCPPSINHIDSAKFWFQPTVGTSDYFNQCGSGTFPATSANIPNTAYGFQQARSGAGFAGIHRWVQGGINYREYLEILLDSSLTINDCYHFEMYINLCNVCKFNTYNIGVYFSDTIITGVPNTQPLSYIPQITNTFGNNPDTLNWTLVSGDYIATGGESYLIIGNFNDDVSTDTSTYNPLASQNAAYVFIDDLSLAHCFPVSIGELNNNTINIYPNPITDKLNVKIKNNEQSEIILYDLSSRKLLQQTFTNTTIINTEQLAKGMYLYEVRNKNGIIKNGKVIKE